MAGLTAPGSVSVLDAGSGTVRRTIPLGKSLSMMALDGRYADLYRRQTYVREAEATIRSGGVHRASGPLLRSRR